MSSFTVHRTPNHSSPLANTTPDNNSHSDVSTLPNMAKLAIAEVDSDESSAHAESQTSKPSKRERLASLGHTVKSKPKQLLNRIRHGSTEETSLDNGREEIEEGITSNAAFNPALTFKGDKQTSLEDKLKGSAQSLHKAGKAALHPRKTATSTAAKRINSSNSPYLTRQADEHLLRAYDELENVTRNNDGSNDVEIARARSVVDRIEKERDEMHTAWITSKHVRRVRVVPRGHIAYPETKLYNTYDADGRYAGCDWGRWLGHVLLYLSQDFTPPYIDDVDKPPFQRRILIQNAERLLVATAPWQSWLMKVRKVYCWDDPWLTGRWLLLYLFLLKTGYFMTYLYSYVFYMVLKHRFYPESADDLRESYRRAIDRSSQVHQIGELVERHGSDQWLEPLIDEMGPLLQQQLGDTADFLEILINFYRWVDTRSTINSLVFWGTCALVSSYTAFEFGNKIVWFVIGLWFFASRPIASRYPKYRKAVSIFRVIYWDIPTFAELAFKQLRNKARETRKEVISQTVDDTLTAERFWQPSYELGTASEVRLALTRSSSTSSTASSDSFVSATDVTPTTESEVLLPQATTIITLRCRWHGHIGRLTLTTNGMNFMRTRSSLSNLSSHPKEPLWSRSYISLVEMRKSRTPSSLVPGSATPQAKKLPSKITSSQSLEFVWADGMVDIMEGFRRVDEAFNIIVGFSNGRWMALTPADEGGGGGRKEKKRMEKLMGNKGGRSGYPNADRSQGA